MENDLNEQKITKQGLVAKMNDLNDLLNNSWDGIAIIDEFGNFVFTNKAFSPVLNYTKDEILKLNFLNLIDAKTRDVMKFGIIKAKKLGSIRNLKLICNRKDKKQVYLEVSLTFMTNKKYFVINAKDSTEELSKKTLINKYVLSCRLDTQGKILEISDAFARLLKFNKYELIDISLSILRYEFDGIDDIKQIFKQIDEDNDWIGVVSVINQKQNRLHLDVKIKEVHNKYGDVVGYESIFFDITKDSEIKNENLANNLISTKTSYQVVSDMMNEVANRWLDPLEIIDKNIHKIKKERDIGTIHSIASAILKTKQSLSKDIENFKDNFVIDEQMQYIDLNAMMGNIAKMLEDNNEKHNISIGKRLENVATIATVPHKLTDIIYSLISNSLEAFGKHKQKNPKLDLTLRQIDDKILIQVIDNAGGIDPNIKERIFDPYFSTKNKHGKGLGLYIVKNVLENHLGGNITIEENEGLTTATISLQV